MSSPEYMEYADGLEPIAIVGMAMRFPGGSHSSEQFWQMLSEGRSAHKNIPKERYDADGFYHPDAARAGAINVKGGYFLSEDPVLFDAPFFSMTSLEATGTDPQQRLMLEVAYESLENAGIPIHSIVGSKTGVYVGCFTNDFESVGGRDPFGGPFYAATGYGASMLSNRVSWFFDLRGPSFTVDTACSSSLYAVHLACQSLRMGETKMSIIGGTNLIYDPSYMRDMCGMTFLSPDGICHSFDHRANGYARGDGIGGMVLKTLKQAVADGDTIRAIIRNSGLGQDGRTPGITMPSPQAHADLIRSTYAGAGLSLDQTSYFEAHGTGTSIGDPYELSAIGATFGKTRSEDHPIYVGSVKTNIGHLEGCAGLAGLIKATLVVERGQIPALAGFEKANPRLRLKEWGIALPETLTPWPTHGVRRVSVNSFGYGGANAHVIVDDAYHYLQKHNIKANHQTHVTLNDSESDSGFSSEDTPGSELGDTLQLPNRLFVFSSADQAGLSRLSKAYKATLDAILDAEKSVDIPASVNSRVTTSNLAYTLGSRRTALDHRTFVVSKSITDLNVQLEGRLPAMRRAAKTNNVFFIFTGQGAQWATMGKELIGHRAFKQSLEVSQSALEILGCKWSIQEELFAPVDISRVDLPEFSQPLSTALQIALVDLLKTWNIKPKSVVGHSSGEIAAAYAAEFLSKSDAMKIAYFRGLYSADVNNRLDGITGAMIAVGLSEEGVCPYLAQVPEKTVAIACINAPSNVTLSGDEASIDQLFQLFTAENIFVRKLKVKTAYHSHHMQTIATDYLSAIGLLEKEDRKESSDVTMFSSVTAAPIQASDLDASYWIKNLTSPVRFSEAVKVLVSQAVPSKTRRKVIVPYAASIEIGPAAALQGPLLHILTAHDDRLASSILYTSILSRGTSAEVSSLNAAGKLWAQGLNIDLHAINFQSSPKGDHQVLGCLPPYVWNHSKGYWHNSAWGKQYRYLRKPRTDLLGLRLQNQDVTEPRYHNFLRLSEQPWISDHCVQKMILYPGSAMITMAIQAAHEELDSARIWTGIEVQNILFKRPLLLPSGDAAIETAIHLRPLEDRKDAFAFRLFSQAEGEEWQENCSGRVSITYGNEKSIANAAKWETDASLYSMIRKRATRKLSPRTFYKFFDKKMNLQYGRLHQNVTECVAGRQEGYGTITIPDTKSVMPSQFEYPHVIHPATLDSVFHMQALGYLHALSGYESLVPISIESVYISADTSSNPGTELKGYSRSNVTEGGDFSGDIVLSDANWLSPKVVVRGFLSRDITAAKPTNVVGRQPRKCSILQWEEFDKESISSPVGENLQIPNHHSLLITKAPRVLILCGPMVAPPTQVMVAELQRVLESFQCSVKVVTKHDLSDGDRAQLSETIVISLIEVDKPFMATFTEEDFVWFKSFALQTSSMLWVTGGGFYLPEESLGFSITTGLLRTLRVEMPQLRLPHLDLSEQPQLTENLFVESIISLLESSVLSDSPTYEQEMSVKEGQMMVPRIRAQMSFHQELSSHAYEEPASLVRLADLKGVAEGIMHGDGTAVVWQYCENVENLGENDIEITTSIVSLESGADLGVDAIGTITRVGASVKDFTAGDTVVVCASHTLKSKNIVDQSLARHLPAFVDPESIVTLPSALCTAQGALLDIGRLQFGERLLIVAKPGRIEQALLSLARQVGAEYYIMAQDSKHEENLIEFHGIDEDRVIIAPLTPEDTTSTLKRITRMDLVVSTLDGNALQESMRFIADFGRFVSVGSSALQSTVASFASNITVANFDLERVRLVSPTLVANMFKSSWDRASQLGLPRPVSARCFPLTKIDASLSFLEGGRSQRSAVLRLKPNHEILIPPPPPAQLKLDPSATYVIAGGLGGIGKSIADMMFEAGARNISFLSRSGADSEEAQLFLGSLNLRGCNAQSFRCDITDPTQLQEYVLQSEQRGENIKGILQCAMVLRDSIFENMNFQQWVQATEPKVQGSWNLHKYMPSDLDFFIMLSSMAGVIGNPGQANYSAAGTYQDALSKYRLSNGLASTTIDLGIVSDVGYIAENPEQFERLDYLENLFISERDLHLILKAAMLGKTRDGVPVPAQLVTGVGKELLSEGGLGIAMSTDLKYVELQDILKASSGATNSSEDSQLKESLMAAVSVREACSIVENVLSTQLAKAMNIEAADVDLEKPMHSFGVDSLVAVEVKNSIYRRMNAEISVFDIVSNMPLTRLAFKVVGKSKFVREDVALLALDEIAE